MGISTCGPSLSFVAVASRLAMGSTGRLTVQKTTKRLRTPQHSRTVANPALHPLSATQIKRINKTVTLDRNSEMQTLVAHKTTRQPSTRISRWLSNDLPITKVEISLLISLHMLQPSKGTTRSSRCTNSTRIR